MNSCVINRISQFYFRFQLISNKIPQGKHLAGTSSHCTVSLVRLNQGIPQTIPTNSYFPTGNPFVFGVPHQIQFCCGHSMEKAGIPAGFALGFGILFSVFQSHSQWVPNTQRWILAVEELSRGNPEGLAADIMGWRPRLRATVPLREWGVGQMEPLEINLLPPLADVNSSSAP